MSDNRRTATFWQPLLNFGLWLYSLWSRLRLWWWGRLASLRRCSERSPGFSVYNPRRKIMRLKTYGTVGQPPEIEKLYRNFPALDQRKTAPVAVGQGVWKLVNDVNKRVNGSIRYTNKSPTDWAGPQQQTHTSGLTGKQVETLVGSCRDYVITKMLELQAQGVPLGAMRIADAYLDGPNVAPEDRHHMVLLLQQEDGRAWILDNRTPEIYDWPGLPHYRWNRVSQPGSEQWGRLTPQQAIGLDAVLQSMASGVPGDGA